MTKSTLPLLLTSTLSVNDAVGGAHQTRCFSMCATEPKLATKAYGFVVPVMTIICGRQQGWGVHLARVRISFSLSVPDLIKLLGVTPSRQITPANDRSATDNSRWNVHKAVADAQRKGEANRYCWSGRPIDGGVIRFVRSTDTSGNAAASCHSGLFCSGKATLAQEKSHRTTSFLPWRQPHESTRHPRVFEALTSKPRPS